MEMLGQQRARMGGQGEQQNYLNREKDLSLSGKREPVSHIWCAEHTHVHRETTVAREPARYSAYVGNGNHVFLHVAAIYYAFCFSFRAPRECTPKPDILTENN